MAVLSRVQVDYCLSGVCFLFFYINSVLGLTPPIDGEQNIFVVTCFFF